MKITNKFFKIILYVFLGFLLKTLTADIVFAENISLFSSDVIINPDGSVNISESINYDFESNSRHGIIRKIPQTKKNQDGEVFKMDFYNFSILDENKLNYKFSQSLAGDHISLKIGDPDKFVSGLKHYQINYEVKGAITYFSDHDEFFWNINGLENEIDTKRVETQINLPQKLLADQVRLACYTGVLNSKSTDCEISYNNGLVQSRATKFLGPGEGLTVVVGMPKGLVAVIEPVQVNKPLSPFIQNLLIILFFIAVLLWYLGLPGYIIWRWFKYGRDPRPSVGEASVWFDAPKTKNHRRLTPGETGTLVDEEADMRDITSTIVDLARRGYLKIIETKKNEFAFEKKTPKLNDEVLQPHEETLLTGLFKSGDLVNVKSLSPVSTVEKVKNQLYQAVVNEKFFDKNPYNTRIIYYVLAGLGLFTGNILLGIVAFTFGRAMPRKTISGAQTAAMARSLKNFLTSQQEKLEFQAKNQMFFEKLLPYAVAFGVEKVWAGRFKDLNLKPPDWYQSYDHRAFSSLAMVSALDRSLNSFSSVATPTRSSSGFSSGFSGGGFSGGGGGGGGTGSW